MKSTSAKFRQNARNALSDTQLQNALANARGGFVNKRKKAVDTFPDFEQLRLAGRQIKEHTLANLDYYLEMFERQALANGARVHWCEDAAAACRTIIEICTRVGAERVIKGKSMVGEEIELNEALTRAGLDPVETDLGEYIIQLAGEPPSHIIAPAVHKSRQQIADLFRKYHRHEKPLDNVASIVDEARQIMREKYINADVGITGANLLIAETGMSVIVTNEGNGDLTATCPPTHIIITSIEKVIPTLEDATVILRLLARSATGQETTSYTSFIGGPRRQADRDGPVELHIVLLDNGRTDMLSGEFHEMLRCIRCGACLNHCPVYNAIGGHAYGWVYPGPMGSVLTPLMTDLEQSVDLPNASTLCGRCQSVCPVMIPLPDLLRRHRDRAFQQRITPLRSRLLLSIWAMIARRPALYRYMFNVISRMIRLSSGSKGHAGWLPLAGNWSRSRVIPATQGKTFMQQWLDKEKRQ